MLTNWIYVFLPRISCALAWVVNPIFIYLIFTESSNKFGNYRFLLLYFALFNLTYSIVNIVVPIDIITYRYSYMVILRDGWFVELSDFNFSLLSARCSLVGATFALILVHFVYRYLAIQNSSLTRENFHWYMTGSIFVSVFHFSIWHLTCMYFTHAEVEMRQYVIPGIRRTFGNETIDFNILGGAFHEVPNNVIKRTWIAVAICTSISVLTVTQFIVLSRMIINKLNSMSITVSKKIARFQFELLRALIVQTTIPIVISFAPCLFCWFIPISGIELPRPFNYYEVSAFGIFPFVDPIAIILCLPIFRARVFSFLSSIASVSSEKPSCASPTK
ncbi:Serpentine Receptor, class J [Caenorhabditis elegans]|uniref:Serpentine Receptor, class J n=1 Tax=Caenorhabditis elegans TaxID=6239 RepID=O16347_CAEEL|nr:Serpentine Receptor, class J [Caenorhabditis elegans]CCD68405.1 Serpentine Receptor, class J [Caenorhabditis elegans]|eukprot:NP_504140.1 Serpentine Receptor, class J [Caenorhabditis elegans]